MAAPRFMPKAASTVLSQAVLLYRGLRLFAFLDLRSEKTVRELCPLMLSLSIVLVCGFGEDAWAVHGRHGQKGESAEGGACAAA